MQKVEKWYNITNVESVNQGTKFITRKITCYSFLAATTQKKGGDKVIGA